MIYFNILIYFLYCDGVCVSEWRRLFVLPALFFSFLLFSTLCALASRVAVSQT